jgi:hypothetical protein
MGGYSPLTWECLDAWSRLTGHQPNVLESAALMALDAVLLAPAEAMAVIDG